METRFHLVFMFLKPSRKTMVKACSYLLFPHHSGTRLCCSRAMKSKERIHTYFWAQERARAGVPGVLCLLSFSTAEEFAGQWTYSDIPQVHASQIKLFPLYFKSSPFSLKLGFIPSFNCRSGFVFYFIEETEAIGQETPQVGLPKMFW